MIGEDEGDVLFPLLTVSTPALVGTSVTASVANAQAVERTITFKIFGVGVESSGKVTVTLDRDFRVPAGQSRTYYARFPCRWERRAVRGQEDNNWLYVEILKDEVGHIVALPKAVPATTVAEETIELRDVSGGSSTVTREHETERSVTFDFALSIPGLTEKVGIKVGAASTTIIAVEAELLDGKNYQLTWLTKPSGARVVVTA